MLRNLPLLELVFDEPDSVRWEDATKLIQVVERQIHRAYARVTAPVGPREWDESSYNASTLRARLAAPIERGSVIIPLTFDLLPVHFEIFAQAKAAPDSLAYIKDTIGLLADAVGLLDFTIGVLYGRYSVLARSKGSKEPVVGGQLASAEAEVAQKFLETSPKIAGELASVAERSGCRYVAVRWGDAEIAIFRDGQAGSDTSAALAPVVEPTKNRLIRRVGDAALLATYAGNTHPAILGRNQWDDREYILIWRAREPMPGPGSNGFEAIGHYGPRNRIELKGRVPKRWREADGAFVVDRATGLARS